MLRLIFSSNAVLSFLTAITMFMDSLDHLEILMSNFLSLYLFKTKPSKYKIME
ncbi:hypothetical protein [Dichelobacter nodosus]|uniref:hypothetical protein n=1 Tax=Dichelobacter nodosus TaxID=870 RepID=UPI001E521098|nr:hypothetical protein [Dichelobacter nodosus]